ncbi:hypothetical protein OG875_04995 [Streptomyces sp. NBC_01498]|uniref:hypothetical protein n=1 Tax=Streptomyces sp. NBC_01498 TaxID=2975870 RepID=UPI002E7AD653|nr:hypothetical protein [Streptomyces sp. NBC_01498]WTL24014.1 hypothetical protein OG875_04995 [Streptomyces sp. NBC_01498]
MSLTLLSDLLDDHEAAEAAVRGFTTGLEVALSTGDELDVRRIEAEAAVYELRTGVQVLAVLDAIQAA